MDIYFTTVVRAAPVERGGELVHLDWDTQTVRQAVPIYPTNPTVLDPNPRGNTRGGRGIALFDQTVMAASYHTLKCFDRTLHFQRDLTHGLMAGLHEISLADAGRSVWVAATSIDAALQYDVTGGQLLRSYWPREMPAFQELLNLQPLTINKQADNRDQFINHLDVFADSSHLHLNAVVAWQGEEYALFSSHGALVNLTTGRVVVQDDAFKRGHNIVFIDNDHVLINGTYQHTLRLYNPQTGRLQRAINLLDYPWVARLVRRQEWLYALRLRLYRLKLRIKPNRPVFVRGLDVAGDLAFVGISPASILCLNWRTGDWVGAFNYARDVRVCIHGLKVAPPGW